MEKSFDNIENVKKLKFEEEWVELRLKVCLLREFWANNLEKIQKSSKTGEDKKSLISPFACFLTGTAKLEFVQGRLGTSVCLHPK